MVFFTNTGTNTIPLVVLLCFWTAVVANASSGGLRSSARRLVASSRYLSVIADENGCFKGTSAAVTEACSGHDCCTGKDACSWPDALQVTVCPGSCNGSQACDISDARNQKAKVLSIREESCNGHYACKYLGRGGTEDSPTSAFLTVEEGSCNGAKACQDSLGDVGVKSCNGPGNVCANKRGNVGRESCNGNSACYQSKGGVGDYSCLDSHACNLAKGDIGYKSCLRPYACPRATGVVADCVKDCWGNTCPQDEGVYDATLGECTIKFTEAQILEARIAPVRSEATVTAEGCFSGTGLEVTKACAANGGKANCCNGDEACVWPEATTVTVCPGSCNGLEACKTESKIDTEGKPADDYTIHVRNDSCNGMRACTHLGRGRIRREGVDTRIGKGSCNAVGTKDASMCGSLIGTVGANSCNGGIGACKEAKGTIGDESCIGQVSCNKMEGEVGDHSCHGKQACFKAQDVVIGHCACASDAGKTTGRAAKFSFSAFKEKLKAGNLEALKKQLKSGSDKSMEVTEENCKMVTGKVGDYVKVCAMGSSCPEDLDVYDKTLGQCKADASEKAATAKEKSSSPSTAPSSTASEEPSSTPSTALSATASEEPSASPSVAPSTAASREPSASPSIAPSTAASEEPSASPSAAPSSTASAAPSKAASEEPSTSPSAGPSAPLEEGSATDTPTCSDTSATIVQLDGVDCFTGTAAAVTCACENAGTCCQGEFACLWPDEAQVTVCPNSCNGSKACKRDFASTLTVRSGSCNELQACHDVGQGDDYTGDCADGTCDRDIGTDSCNGPMSCSRSRGQVGNNSCNFIMACYLADVLIGHNTCNHDDDETCPESTSSDSVSDEDAEDRRRLKLKILQTLAEEASFNVAALHHSF